MKDRSFTIDNLAIADIPKFDRETRSYLYSIEGKPRGQRYTVWYQGWYAKIYKQKNLEYIKYCLQIQDEIRNHIIADIAELRKRAMNE